MYVIVTCVGFGRQSKLLVVRGKTLPPKSAHGVQVPLNLLTGVGVSRSHFRVNAIHDVDIANHAAVEAATKLEGVFLLVQFSTTNHSYQPRRF